MTYVGLTLMVNGRGDTSSVLIVVKNTIQKRRKSLMIDLIFDTETTGFVHRSRALVDSTQPYLVQLAAILADGDEILEQFCLIVKCPIEVPEGAFAIHGIDQKMSQRLGLSSRVALTRFSSLASRADRMVAHNMSFDIKILAIAFARQSIRLPQVEKVCTMKSAHRHLKTIKWPKLQAAYQELVDPEGFSDAHSADADAMACFKVLRALEQKGAELIE